MPEAKDAVPALIEALKDEEVMEEQRRMAEIIADNTNVEELPW